LKPNLSHLSFQYPEPVIQIAFLDLLLCLTKNSRDVVKFLMTHHFDVTLLGKVTCNFCLKHFPTCSVFIVKYMEMYPGPFQNSNLKLFSLKTF